LNRKKEFFKRIFKAIVGLEIFSIGIYFFIQANIGLPPWDVLSMGISYQVPGLTYGDACTIVSLIVLGIDLLLKERLGFGSLLDALLVGKSVDLWAWIGFLPEQSTVPAASCLRSSACLSCATACIFIWMPALLRAEGFADGCDRPPPAEGKDRLRGHAAQRRRVGRRIFSRWPDRARHADRGPLRRFHHEFRF
jgi:hypothetical protein